MIGTVSAKYLRLILNQWENTRYDPQLMSEIRKTYQSIQDLLKDNLRYYQAKDLVLIKRLQKSSKLMDLHLIELLTWWKSGVESDRPLLDFLIHSKVLTAKARRMLEGKIKPKALEIDDFITTDAVQIIQSRVDSKEETSISEPNSLNNEINEDSVNEDSLSPSTVEKSKKVSESANSALKVGARLGKCILKRLIGKGSTCLVFEGFHETLKIKVAVKVFLSNSHFPGQDSKTQFSLEARTLAKLNHPYIVRVLDYEDGKFPFITLEYVEGNSLAELIEEHGPLECRKAALIIYRCAIGLMVAHQNGIVHRDIKPANILLSTTGEAKLTDLGLAHIKSNITSNKDARAKTAGHFNGTPAYAAPEQAFDPNAGDYRSDIYSLGATFYHAVTGQFPFEGDSVYAVVMKHINDTLIPAHEIKSSIPLEISECIQTMMEKDPEDRFQSVEEMLPELISFFLTVEADSGSENSRAGGNQFGDSIAGPITRVIFRSMKKMVDTSNKRQLSRETEATKNLSKE